MNLFDSGQMSTFLISYYEISYKNLVVFPVRQDMA